jgi:WD40 repeat protein
MKTVFDKNAQQVVVIRGYRLGVLPINESSDRAGLRVWDTQTGQLKMDSDQRYVSNSFGYPDADDEFLAFMPNGKYFIRYSGGIQLWNIATDHPAFSSIVDIIDEWNPEKYRRSGDLHGIAIDTEGIYLAEGRGSGIIFITQLGDPPTRDNYKLITYLRTPGFGETGHSEWDPNALSFSPNRHWLVVGAKKHFFVLDLQKGGREHFSTRLSLTSQVSAVAFDPNGNMVLHGSKNGWQIWDVENKKLMREDTSVPVYAVAFSPDGEYFATGDANGVVRVWGIR